MPDPSPRAVMSGLDPLRQELPEGVTLTEDLDGITITYRQPGSLRSVAVGLLGAPVVLLLTIGGAVAGMVPWGLAIREGGWLTAAGFLGAPITTVVGLLGGLYLGGTFQQNIERLVGITHPVQLAIQEHTIILGTRTLPISDIHAIEHNTILLRSGEKLLVAPGARDGLAHWLTALLRTTLADRSEGSRRDIPPELLAMKQPVAPS